MYLYTEEKAEEEEEVERESTAGTKSGEHPERGEEGGRDGESAVRTTTGTQQRASLFNTPSAQATLRT